MGAKAEGLTALQIIFQNAADRAVPDAKKVVGKACSNIKKGAQRIIRSDSHYGYLPHYPRSIRYEVSAQGYRVRGRVGPRSEYEQGGLGGLLEYGSVNNAPIPHMLPALELETPSFVDYCEQLARALLEGTPVEGPVVDTG